MLTQPQVQRYANESGLRDMLIAEKEVVLTFLLQLLSERGILDRLAFKGGTCLRENVHRRAGKVFDRSGLHGNRGARS
jgi:predicted nucleotidyltransferase component of viral defense system